MKLYLIGHDYKYAAEQMMLSLYPAERPEYPEGKPEGDRVELSLRKGKKFITCVCRIAKDDKMFVGRSAFNAELAADDLSRDRLCSRIIKNAFYRAALRSGHSRPAWGSLTGVRPGKLFCAMLDETGDPDTATRRFITEYDVSPERAKLCRDTSLVTRSVAGSLGDKDICLYVGIPFCPTRCSYCSFVSQSVQKSMKLIPPFLDALMLEIDAAAKAVNELGLHIISIYMGGGTPTTLSAEQLDRLCSKISDSFDLTHLREYTVEAGRPDTITTEKLRVLRSHGVDRVSVNPQTIKSMEGRIMAIMRDYIVRKEETTLFDIKADGAFSMKLHVPYPMFVLVYPLTEVYACPGDTVDVTMDTTKPSREEGIILDGTGVSGEVSRLINNIRTTYCDFPARDNIHEKGPDSLMTWRDVQVACLDDVTRQTQRR